MFFRTQQSLWRRLLALGALAAGTSLLMGGCFEDEDDDPTFGEAFSDVGDAFEDFTDEVF